MYPIRYGNHDYFKILCIIAQGSHVRFRFRALRSRMTIAQFSATAVSLLKGIRNQAWEKSKQEKERIESE